MKKPKDSQYKPYWFLVILRVVIVFVPQLGYIHPDELFQSVEIFAGKIFDVEYSPPWEFNSTFPIRSMAITYFTVGVSYRLLIIVNAFVNLFLKINLLSPYCLLIVPRLIMCLCSFLVDYCFYKICVNNNEKYKSKLFILATSYVMLIYGSRTFSNTIELLLFALLLYFVCESLTFSNILVKKKEYINYRYEKSKKIEEKVKFFKLNWYLENDSLRNCFYISTITVFGFFNRPTFLAFAVFPLFFWLYRGIGSKCVVSIQFHYRILVLILSIIPSLIFCILMDSFFYGYITWGEIGMLDVSINSFVFTPLNFFKYNIDSSNLAKHGLHPRYLHILVNIPLLYNVLGVSAFSTLVKYSQMIYHWKFNLLPSVRSIKGLMTLSVIAPTLLLSIFPHQEPRFLIPLILPLCYLHANDILDESSDAVSEVSKSFFKQAQIVRNDGHILLKIWLTINTILCIFYGFLHQGGVYQATSYLYNDLQLTPKTTEYHIVTSHIYSLPESFLFQKPSGKIYKYKNKTFVYSRRVYLNEEGSKNLTLITNKLQNIINTYENTEYEKNKPKKYKIFLIIPSILRDELYFYVKNGDMIISELKTFPIHVSTEVISYATDYCLEYIAPIYEFYETKCIPLSMYNYFNKLYSLFGLTVFKVAPK